MRSTGDCSPYPKYLDWVRYLCAYLLLTYGLSKLAGVQFKLPPEIAMRPVGSLSGYQLTWYYYSYSRTYASILGLTQLAGAAMLLFPKTALLGAAVMTPIMANIVMIQPVFSHCFRRGVYGGVHLRVDVGVAIERTERALAPVLERSGSGAGQFPEIPQDDSGAGRNPGYRAGFI
jgi:uncharacterized membrane protein YphA (DoxX/SURF4 family)